MTALPSLFLAISKCIQHEFENVRHTRQLKLQIHSSTAVSSGRNLDRKYSPMTCTRCSRAYYDIQEPRSKVSERFSRHMRATRHGKEPSQNTTNKISLNLRIVKHQIHEVENKRRQTRTRASLKLIEFEQHGNRVVHSPCREIQ